MRAATDWWRRTEVAGARLPPAAPADERGQALSGDDPPALTGAQAAAPADTVPHRGLGLLLASLGAVAFSGKAIIIKLAYRHGVDAVTLLMLRMLFSLPLFVALAWWSGRGKPPLTRRDLATIVGLGFTGYYLASFLDFAGLAYITASLERLILYLNPTIVLAIGVIVFKRRVSAKQAAALAVSYVGVLVVFGHELYLRAQSGGVAPGDTGGWGAAGLGALLVFASAVSYAVYLVYSGEEVRRLGSLRLTGLATTVACFLCIGQFLVLRPLGSVLDLAPPVLWLSVLNATACTFAPVLMTMMAIERIGSGAAAQAGMIGPLSTVIMGVVLLDEPFTAWIAAGTVLVLAGVTLLARSR